MANLMQFFLNLKDWGFFNFLLPWLLVFAIVYGLLMTVKLFGEVNKKVSAVVAFVVAFFATAFVGQGMATFFSLLFGNATIFLSGILVVILFIAMIGWTPEMGKGGRNWKIAAFILILIGVAIFFVSSGIVISGVILNDSTITGIFIIVIIVLAMWFITRGEGGKPAATGGAKPGEPHHP